jgi:hypothetical protein
MMGFKTVISVRTFNHLAKAFIVALDFASTRSPSPRAGTTTQPLLFLSFLR